MSKHSIAIFAPQFMSTGVVPAMMSLSQELSKNGSKVELISSVREWRDVRGAPGENGVTAHSFKAGAFLRLLPAEGRLRFRLSNIIAAVILVFSLGFYLRTHRPQVLISAMQPMVAVLAVMLSRSDVNLIISAQGAPRPGGIRKMLWNALWRRADSIVCESQSIATRLEEILDVTEGTVRVIYNPHYDVRINELAKAEDQYSRALIKSEFTAVAVGRLTPQKGFDVAIRAIQHAAKEIDVRLLILGNGSERERLERLCEDLGLSERISFLGQIDNPYKVIADSDVFISSSRWEGLARAPIEAQALRVPVIATDIDGGIRETVLDGRAGVLVAFDDPGALSREIIELLKNKTRMSEIVEIASREIGRFSSERAASQYLGVIETITGD
jgi:glycosyltransferase involved in cell wall biosynthesis